LLLFRVVIKRCESAEEHHAFENEQIRNKQNHEQKNIVIEIEKKYVVIVTSTQRQRCADY
jgi:hypothetical protein